MKKPILLITAILLFSAANAQFGLLDRAKQKAKDKVNQKIDQKMDKAIGNGVDTVDNAISGKNKQNKSSSNTNTPVGNDGDIVNSNTSATSATNSISSLKSYSKFDFVPGEKMVAAEDFSQDATGDFPDKWNTNGSGEIVTANKLAGKLLMTQKNVVFYPEWIKNLPDNFTLEFDLMSTDKYSYYSGYFVVGFTTEANVGKDFRKFATYGNGRLDNGGGFEAGFHPQGASGNLGMINFYSSNNGTEILRNEAGQDKFNLATGKTTVHISIWRQKSRVRVYMDDKKVWDLPKALADGAQLNSLYFRNDGAENDNDSYYMGNMRLAVGAADTRNKLITEGKFVTHGILFDINSDKIKAESYGALKDIAAVLNENAAVRVKITGHTDSDGDDASNLTLSKKRAEAVKNSLAKDFGIDAARMETDGKGESQPVDNNTTSLGKANNRRVEFVKL